MSYKKIKLGKGYGTKWHIYQGKAKNRYSVCGKLYNPSEVVEEYPGKGGICKSCLDQYEYRDPYVRKLREFIESPISDRPSLPLKRDNE